jgi:hypothetical protein
MGCLQLGDSPAGDAIVARFVRACQSSDVDAWAALLTDDVFISMPPMACESEGRDAAARFCAGLFGDSRLRRGSALSGSFPLSILIEHNST